MYIVVRRNRSEGGIQGQRYLKLVIYLLLVLNCGSSSQGQQIQKSEAYPQKVLLRWKLKPGQVYKREVVVSANTCPQNSILNIEFEWHVQSLLKNGNASIKNVVKRVRLHYRSDKVKFDYDTESKTPIVLPEIERSYISLLLLSIQMIRKQEHEFILSDRGLFYSTREGQSFGYLHFPKLPEEAVGVGDTWIDDSLEVEPKRRNTLAKLEEIDGQTVAWIDSDSESGRYRFLVDAGRYLDTAVWNAFPGADKSKVPNINSASKIERFQLTGDDRKLQRWKPLQPQQRGIATQLISDSHSFKDQIVEYLVDEKSMLSRIQETLWLEHAKEANSSKPDDRWQPMDWLMFARYWERKGDYGKSKQLLQEGARSLIEASEENSPMRNYFLLQFVELLVGIKDFGTAIQVCNAIPSDTMSGLNLTDEGPVHVSSNAMRSYGLFLVAQEQAKLGLTTESMDTAELIVEPSYQAVTHWTIAMHSADRGEGKSASENAIIAEGLNTKRASIVEFGTNGPTPVPVNNYRTLALGKLAICQAKHDDETAMWNTISSIKIATERGAVMGDVIISLDKTGKHQLADQVFNELPKSSRKAAIEYRIKELLRSSRFEEAEKVLESISDPTWKVSNRIQYCKTLSKESGRIEDIQKQRGLIVTDIREITSNLSRATALIDFSELLLALGDKRELPKQLMEAHEIIEKRTLQDAKRIDLHLRIASILAGLDTVPEFNDITLELEEISKSFANFENSDLQLSLVKVYLLRDAMRKSEELADGIENASIRCQALTEVAKHYAQLLEIARSREVFSKAYAAAMQVVDVTGLDTPYSKGGAARMVGREQGAYDLEGVIIFANQSKDANLRAYALIGGVESIDLDAAAAAMKVGRLPRGMFQKVCESNIVCEILEGRSPFLEQTLQ